MATSEQRTTSTILYERNFGLECEQIDENSYDIDNGGATTSY